MGKPLPTRDPRSDPASLRTPSSLQDNDLFHTFVSLADALTAMFGSACEVVVHDYADLDRSIVHITGNVTGRKVGGTLTDLGLAILRQGQVPDSLINYTTYAPNGHPLTSTTVFIKDNNGVALGGVCINIDTSELTLPGTVGRPPPPSSHNLVETFADTPEAVTRNAFGRLLAAKGLTDAHALSRAQRIDLIQKLDQAGVFFLRGAADTVARLLGVTRSTVYVYLRASANNTNKEES
jgi:predicted transcriptional regulator YheO